MTCEHCARAVSAELRTLPGVVGVSVDVPGGAVTIRTDETPDLAAVRAALDEAGYELVGAATAGGVG
jgi:copper chaperone CopZ